MPDISTLWHTTYGDWSLAGADLESGDDIVTAVLISLFTDRLAGPDDVLTDGTTDRRGWWADSSNNAIGSRLWLLTRAKHTTATLGLAEAFIAEALQWLIDDGVATKVDIHVEWHRSDELCAQITVHVAGFGRSPVQIGVRGLGHWEHLTPVDVPQQSPLRLDGTWRLDGSQILDGIKR
jgi:phage gp46-like protein